MPKLPWFFQGSCDLVLVKPGLPEKRIPITDGLDLAELLKQVNAIETEFVSLSPETLAD